MTSQPVSDIRDAAAAPPHLSDKALAAIVVLSADDEVRVVVVDLLSHPCGEHILAESTIPRSGEEPSELAQSAAAGELIRSLGAALRPVPLTVVRAAETAAAPTSTRLSAREVDVLELVTEGLSNQEIAEQLFLSINSVKTYIRTGYRKIGVARRTQAVSWGVRHGLGAHVET